MMLFLGGFQDEVGYVIIIYIIKDYLYGAPSHKSPGCLQMIIIMYIYHVLINALSTHMIHINLNMIFCTHVECSPIKCYMENKYTHTQE